MTDSVRAAAAGAAEGSGQEPSADAGVRPSEAPLATQGSTSPLLDLGATRAGRVAMLALLVIVVLLFLVPPPNYAGLWDPHELRVADLARRIAVNLHGAANLGLEGADNSLPHLNDLGRPQLAFTLMALGFKLFGLHEWAGRVPLVLFAAVGAFALYGALARLVHARAGLFAAMVLVTTPLYFVQARTMLGDGVAMAAVAIAWSGLAVAAYDDAPKASRLAWLLLGLGGLLAGYFSRGGLLGLGVPLLAVGLSWALCETLGRGGDRLGRGLGFLALASGLYVLARSWSAVRGLGPESDLSPWLGALFKPPSKYPTFDIVLAQVGHAAAPWSALVPFALGRLFWSSTGSVRGARGGIEWRLDLAKSSIVMGMAVALALHTAIAPYTEPAAFVGIAFGAAAIGVMLFDYERGAHPSLAVGLGTAAAAFLLQHDFKKLPEKGFQAFAVLGTTFPEGFKTRAELLAKLVFLGVGVLVFLTFLEQHSSRKAFQVPFYTRVLRELRQAWDGKLALGYLSVVATCSVAGLVVWLGTRFRIGLVLSAPLHFRERILQGWWVLALVPIVSLMLCLFVRDLWQFAFSEAGPLSLRSTWRGLDPHRNLLQAARTPTRVVHADGSTSEPLAFVDDGERQMALGLFLLAVVFTLPLLVMGFLGDVLRGSRAAGLALTGTVLASVLSVGYYPALANQLSPREVFTVYRQTKHEGEPLALLNVGGRTAAYYAGEAPLAFSDVTQATRWLEAGGEQGGRRFMVLRVEDLARVNQAYREKTSRNLPVLYGHQSQILLGASRLLPGENNDNPLERYLLATPPQPTHPLDVELDGKVRALGFDVLDAAGKPAPFVVASREYTLRFYFEVKAKLDRDWEGFIHIDGQKRRHNGDHKLCDGKFPATTWQPGDIVVDEYPFTLPPNFSAGDYSVFYGLWQGETRMKVTQGPSDGDNRIKGGTLVVR